jgi:Zn-finger nucleic acid-binding protein
MFVGSRFCARCGAEATRGTVEDPTPFTCPRCSEPLKALRLGATTARECAACGGLWLDPESLQALCNAREEHAGVVAALAARVPTRTMAPSAIHYLPCPKCRKLMNRVNFSHTSGVIVDVCKADGVWLDRGDLERVVGFVDHGGLTAAREHERDQLAEERRRLNATREGTATTVTDYQNLTVEPSLHGSLAGSPVAHSLLDVLNLFVK